MVLTLLAVMFSACGAAPAAVPTLTRTSSPSYPSPSATRTAPPKATASGTATATPTPQPFAERIVIVEYHHSSFRLADEVMMKTEWFQTQMDWLVENGYRTLTAEELDSFLAGGNVPAKSVVLTFDIGTAQRADYIENIIPALKQHGFHALFFVVTSVVADVCGGENKVCWQDLRDWAAQGLISVESHGVHHPDFTAITAAEQRWDAETSRQIITEKTGRSPMAFAYPFDSFNEGASKVIESLGYRFALAGNTRNDRSVHRADPDRYHLPRMYPYSNPQIYPAIYAAYGKTFGELIAEYSPAVPAFSPTAENATAATATAATPVVDSGSYFSACAKIDQIADSSQRLYAMEQLSIPADVTAETLAGLSAPIISKPSCNVARGNFPRGIVLHITRGTLQATLSEFQRPLNTSAHYVIDRDGQIYQMVPENLGAFHASCGGSRSVCLPTCPLCERPDGTFLEPYLQSIGIELVNDGQLAHPETYTGPIYEDYLMSFGYRHWEDFPQAQLQAMALLVNDIRARYGIPLALVVGHYRINYKTDPGPALNISWYRVGNPAREPIFSE
ncbi:MAG: polysaccharide deacetylase family protein [Anaerolineales bacterium]|nr:polysaccharide deacetylase family protein [Anaerolineales bacterium]